MLSIYLKDDLKKKGFKIRYRFKDRIYYFKAR